MIHKHVNAEETAMIAKAHQCLPGGSVGNIFHDLIIRSGRGSHVWDLSGNEYVDYLMGSGPMLVGHAHPEVVAAVKEQVERGSTFFVTHEKAIELAEEIVAAVPCAEKVRYTSSGTEANQFAMRVARTFRNRDRILKFEGGFHGMHDYALMSFAPTKPAAFPTPTPDSPGIPDALKEQVLIAPFNNIETTTAIIERHHDELAGVIVEPFQRVIRPKPGFLTALREITQRYEVPLIFDEVVTGFRLAYGGAQTYYGVTPDLCSLGKVCAGGYPLAAVAGPAHMMACFDPTTSEPRNFIPQIGTLNGNPISAAAGLATLNILKRKGTYERLASVGEKIKNGLQNLLDEAHIPAQVVGESAIFDVFFTNEEITDYRSTLSADKQMLQRFNALLRERGVYRGDTKFYLSTVHNQEDVDLTIEAFAAAIDELRNQ